MVRKGEDGFAALVSEKARKQEEIVREDLIKDPQFVPSDIFFTSDIAKRKAAVREFLHPSEVGFSILANQFLTNIILRHKLEGLLGPLAKIQELSQMDIAKDHDISDLPDIVRKLQSKYSALKTGHKQLQAAFKKAHTSQVALAQSDSEQKSKVAQLTLQNENLGNEIEVLKVKFQVAANELSLKTNECANLGEFVQQIRTNVSDQQSDSKQRLERLELELQEKTKECTVLSELIRKFQNTIDSSTNRQIKHSRKQEEVLKQKIVELQAQNESLEEQLNAKKKTAKRNERSLKEQYEASIKEIAGSFEGSKIALEQTVSELKEKANKAREMSKKLAEAISETEAKNHKLTETNAQLSTAQKAAVAQITGLKQQLAKEKQHVQAQIAAQTMACDSKVNAAASDAKATYEKEIQELLDAVIETIGEFYDLDPDDFDSEAFKNVIERVKSDLLKLQVFQSQATQLKA
jgi:chromosome segregation ATPase